MADLAFSIGSLQAAQAIVNSRECHRSLAALQSVICISVYLATNRAISSSRAYVAQACSAVYVMGLHEQSSKLVDEERYRRFRTLNCLKIIDAYISSLLGLPRLLQGIRTICWDKRISTDQSIMDVNPIRNADTLLQLLQIQAEFFESHGPGSKPLPRPDHCNSPAACVMEASDAVDQRFHQFEDRLKGDCDASTEQSM